MRPTTLLLLGATAAGCKADTIRDQAALAHNDGRVIAVHPADGSLALRGDVGAQIVLGEDAAGRLPRVRLVGPAQTWEPPCALDAEGLWVTCDPFGDLPKDEALDLEVSFRGELAAIATISRDTPGGVPGYLFTAGASVTRFGGDAEAAAKVSELFQGSDMALLVDGYAGEPGNYQLLGGLIDLIADQPASFREPGLTFVQDIVVGADGRFAGRPQNAFLPVYVDTQYVQVLIQDCAIEGRLSGGAITGLQLSGVIPAISLVQMTAPLGNLADLVLGKITLDQDTDGDGEPDAASFTLVAGQSPEIALVQP